MTSHTKNKASCRNYHLTVIARAVSPNSSHIHIHLRQISVGTKVLINDLFGGHHKINSSIQIMAKSPVTSLPDINQKAKSPSKYIFRGCLPNHQLSAVRLIRCLVIMGGRLAEHSAYKWFILALVCTSQLLGFGVISSGKSLFGLYFSDRYRERVISFSIGSVAVGVANFGGKYMYQTSCG